MSEISKAHYIGVPARVYIIPPSVEPTAAKVAGAAMMTSLVQSPVAGAKEGRSDTPTAMTSVRTEEVSQRVHVLVVELTGGKDGGSPDIR